MYVRLKLLCVVGYALFSFSLHAAEQSSSSVSSAQKDCAGGVSQLEHEESEKKKSAEASDNQWELYRSFKEHTDTIVSLEFYGSGLTSGSRDHTAKVWDVGAGKLLYTLGPTYFTQTITRHGKQGEPDSVEEVRTTYVPRACAVQPLERVEALVWLPGRVLQRARMGMYDQSVIITEATVANSCKDVICGVVPAPSTSWYKVSALAFNVSGNMLAVGYSSGSIAVWRQKVVSKALQLKDIE